eukprot:PhF_6_TR28348/c0_g1_i1/m.42032/K16302/CNNM; metal transporter CNNM
MDPELQHQLTHIGIVVGLICISGTAAGLTLAFFSLDALHLRVLTRAGTEVEQKRATRVLSVLKNHHLLLVTLLLWNAGVNEALPIFLEDLVSPYVAIVLSVTAVLLFGEIIPQAVCAKYALTVCSTLAPIVRLMMILTSVIAYPISLLLDCIVGTGEENKMWKRDELREVLKIHGPARKKTMTNLTRRDTSIQLNGSFQFEAPLNDDEVTLMMGALSLTEKCVGDLKVIPIDEATMLEQDVVFTAEVFQQVREGHGSRIPVFSKTRDNIIGVLLVKTLVGVPAGSVLSKACQLRSVLHTEFDTPLFDLYKLMNTQKSYVAVVKTEGVVTGIITLEAVFEALLQVNLTEEGSEMPNLCLRRKPSGYVGRARANSLKPQEPPQSLVQQYHLRHNTETDVLNPKAPTGGYGGVAIN